jgi:hypothetical protein
MKWVKRVGFAVRFVVSGFTAMAMLLSAPAADEAATKDSPPAIALTSPASSKTPRVIH